MKRGFVLLVLLLLILPYVIAEDAPANTSNSTQVDVAGAVNTFKNKVEGADNLFEKEQEIPANIQPFVKILFRFDGTITVSQSIIALMLLIFFAVFFIDILQSFGPFTENTAKIGGLVLVLIFSMIGSIKSLTSLLLNIGGQFSFLENWSAGALTFAVVLIIIVFIVGGKLFKAFARAHGLETAFQRGTKVGADIAFVEGQKKITEKMGND